MTSLALFISVKASSANTATLGGRASAQEFGGGGGGHSSVPNSVSPALASPYHLYVVPEDFLFLQHHRGFGAHSRSGRALILQVWGSQSLISKVAGPGTQWLSKPEHSFVFSVCIIAYSYNVIASLVMF